MPPSSECPSPQNLEQALLGLGSDEDSIKIESHLQVCPHCLEESRRISAEDTWIEVIRRRNPQQPQPPLPDHMDALIQQMKQIPQMDQTIVGHSAISGKSDDQALVETISEQRPQPQAAAHETRGTAGVLGNYLLLEKIGAGGMGQVFKARHQRMDRVVALKVLSAKFLQDNTALARFEREVKAAARITHPNIVAAFDADVAGNEHFLVMEYVEGSDLSALVKKSGTFSVPQAVDCILQAARGLEAAHANGIVHRDIKPANLLLDKKGTIKILDMGLARIHNDTAAQAELTATGAVMGTVDFMSPEQALDSKAVDARADIYSLGCTLYYLLSGSPTYRGETLTARLLAHQSSPIPDLRSVRSDVPEQLEKIFQKMICKKASGRYQSMTELIADLESASPSAGIALPPHRPMATSSAAADDVSRRRKRWLAICGAAAAAMILLAVIVIRVQTKNGTLVVTVDVPGANVQVLDENGRTEPAVKITPQGEQDSFTISAPVGKHQLKIEKAGFIVYTKEFAVELGPNETIRAELVPLDQPPVARDVKAPTIDQAKTVDRAKESSGMKKVEAKEPGAWDTAGFKAWMADVADMRPGKQVQAVIKKLQELNPGFDPPPGSITGTDVQIVSEQVMDISPLRALTKLENLLLDSSALKDLSPLRGMALKSLDCTRVNAVDLSSLQGMPLTKFHWKYNNMGDLSQLQGLPLEDFYIMHSPVADLSFLRGMPLSSVFIFGGRVGDLSPLQGAPLKSLTCYGNFIFDLSPLKGMPLETLNCGNTFVSDLSPLQGMPLKELYIGLTLVADLSPLKGMRLARLDITRTEVTDLSPLAGMSLTVLHMADTPVNDVSPLQEFAVSQLQFTPQNISKGIDTLRELKSLKTFTVDQATIASHEFWQKYDARDYAPRPPITTPDDPAFQQWMKDVAAMPAEEQVKAVAKKLQELNPGFGGDCTHQIVLDQVTEFYFNSSRVRDISPVLALKSLHTLGCSGSGSNREIDSELTDLSPLKGMQLKQIHCILTRISDLSPLIGMPLTYLRCSMTRITDLSPLKGMKLRTLVCDGNAIPSLSPLEGMPLEALDCANTAIADLAPLKGMRLKHLRCFSSRISDLSPLDGMPLQTLHCARTWVKDLSPLEGMPLTDLFIHDTRVTDLSPLRDSNLRILTLTPERIQQGLDIARQMKGIELIGRSDDWEPRDVFWKKYDEGRLSKVH